MPHHQLQILISLSRLYNWDIILHLELHKASKDLSVMIFPMEKSSSETASNFRALRAFRMFIPCGKSNLSLTYIFRLEIRHGLESTPTLTTQ